MKSPSMLIPVLFFMLLVSCRREQTSPPALPPVITNFSPSLGLPGDTVIITGTGFSPVANNNTVKFAGDITAIIVTATATQLKVTVPASAATGAITVAEGAQKATTTAGFEILKDIPRTGLVAWYPFNGNANDTGGHAYNLTPYGTYSPVTDRFGTPGKAFYFNGGNSSAYDFNTADAQTSEPMTIGMWIKYDTLIEATIMGKYQLSVGGYLVHLFTNGSIEMLFNGLVNRTTSAGLLPANTGGQWIFLLISYDGANWNVYKNAQLLSSIAYTGSVSSSSGGKLQVGLIGVSGTGPNSPKCSYDDVTIYNRLLNDTEIQQLYTQTVSKK